MTMPIEAELQWLKPHIQQKLAEIAEILPSHYRLTLVARSTEFEEARSVFSADENISEVIKAIREAKRECNLQ